MASAITRTILRRRKTIVAVEDDTECLFPLRELPYELQLMVARECVLTPIPITVGEPIARWHKDPEERQAARSCKAMLGVSRDFREELYRLYYEQNTFELGYYYDKKNFFRQPGTNLIQYVLLDALRCLIEPKEVPLILLDNLKLLPNLKRVSIRLRGSLLQNNIFNLLIRMSRALAIDSIELLIERPLDVNVNEEQLLQEYKDFLNESLTVETIWPSFIPAKRKMIEFSARWERISAARLQSHLSNTSGERVKTGRIKNLITLRKSSIA